MLADVAVQIASEVHARQIAEMSRDYIENGLGWRWRERRVLGEIRDLDTNVVVVVLGSEVRAFGIMCYEDAHAHLILLAVRPEYRRKRLASAIITWLEAAARAAGAKKILVDCRRSNSAARTLYLVHDYHEKTIELDMYRQSEDGIHLEKWLQ